MIKNIFAFCFSVLNIVWNKQIQHFCLSFFLNKIQASVYCKLIYPEVSWLPVDSATAPPAGRLKDGRGIRYGDIVRRL